MKVKKITTDHPELLYVGTKYGEEYYQNTAERRGWSFMGLRPATEETLRERARDADPAELLGLSRSDFRSIQNYFDHDRFANDMEQDWDQAYDVQATRTNEEGEVLYLGFGSGQSIDSYFKNHGIIDYATYLNHFDEVGLTQEEFTKVMADYGV
jgi:hypothetical protein